MPEEVMAGVRRRIAGELLANPEWAGLRESLREEILDDYHSSLRTAIVNYILMVGKHCS